MSNFVYEILEFAADPALVAEVRRMDKSGEAIWAFDSETGDAALIVVDGGEIALAVLREARDFEASELLLERCGL